MEVPLTLAVATALVVAVERITKLSALLALVGQSSLLLRRSMALISVETGEYIKIETIGPSNLHLLLYESKEVREVERATTTKEFYCTGLMKRRID